MFHISEQIRQEEFVKVREFIDNCLEPEGLSPAQLRKLTFESEKLLRMVKKVLVKIRKRVIYVIHLAKEMKTSGESVVLVKPKNYERMKLAFNKSPSQVNIKTIKMIRSLSPQSEYIGVNEFEGYHVFLFKAESRKIAVLESPKAGNATYIFLKRWKKLSQLTKTELLEYHQSKFIRIFHTSGWEQRLQNELKRLNCNLNC